AGDAGEYFPDGDPEGLAGALSRLSLPAARARARTEGPRAAARFDAADVSAIVVSHRSAAEASACVASLQRAFAEEGIAGEVVLVDCGSGEQEAGLLRAIPADRHLLL